MTFGLRGVFASVTLSFMDTTRLTNRGWTVLYVLLAVLAFAFLSWAETAWFDPNIDHARVDAEQLQ